MMLEKPDNFNDWLAYYWIPGLILFHSMDWLYTEVFYILIALQCFSMYLTGKTHAREEHIKDLERIRDAGK